MQDLSIAVIFPSGTKSCGLDVSDPMRMENSCPDREVATVLDTNVRHAVSA
ncbi:MAG: hypothetical protein HYY79_02520 [Betaproteobacteria bacterium]|nr:hypothetical protein [Betaproteobacteria bacterium]